MSSITYKVWLGRKESLAIEISKLLSLLKRVQNKQISLLLSPQPMDECAWIGDECYKQWTSYKENGYIGLLTSGTTGDPKIIWQPLHNIITHKRKNKEHDSAWLLCYNPARWAGLSLLLHIIDCGRLIIPNDLEIMSIIAQLTNTTHLSLTPSLFRKMLVTDQQLLLSAPIRRIIFGGEYVTQKLLDTVHNLFPQAIITHVYASTELGDISATNDGKEGIPIANIKLPFYLENHELIINHYHTGDLWKQDNGRLYFMGRKENVINVGGYKVYAHEIENLIMTIPGIEDCIIYAIPNHLLGQVVGLQYVGTIQPHGIQDYLRSWLPKPAIPIVMTRVDELNVTNAWKKSCVF